ncbi:hypothetical protein HGO97_015360 [Faecalicatena sp. AGMB00832]|uniref:ABC-2 type transport system permease protein n=1 Tax=Faecalicatena faecalis TaxID=2726362 RepID=A0ABS6D6G2_9FIRM|nr:hypothetical protein [Faecalicatena faecalis]MBU3877183.1 hypothetical protein [Faecalicatena faecalis]
MNIFCKNILDFLRIDFLLTFKNSLLLGIAYLFIIPIIRGISNLDNIQSAEVLGQSLALVGAIILIPVTKRELETGIKEIIYTKSWSYMKSVSIRLICSILLTAVMIFVFAFVMKTYHCVFPFWKYISVTVLYAIFMGSLGLVFSQAGNSDVIGYLSVLGYWTFCQLEIISESSVLNIFPIIDGTLGIPKLITLFSITISLLVLFVFQIKCLGNRV